MKSTNYQCWGCIKPAICYLDGEYDSHYNQLFAWCDECSKCREKDCDKFIKYRIEWIVGCNNELITLYKDVCENHSVETCTPDDDCNCSKTSKNITKKEFTFI